MVKRFDNWGVNSAGLDPVVCRSITMDLNSQVVPNCSVLLWRISKWKEKEEGTVMDLQQLPEDCMAWETEEEIKVGKMINKARQSHSRE